MAGAYGWTKEYIISDLTIPEAIEFSNRILYERAVEKYDKFISAMAPNSKKAREIGNSYLSHVKKYEMRLTTIREKEMSKEEVEKLFKFLGKK